MNLVLCIVPVKMNSDVSRAGPVCLDFVVFLEYFQQVLGVLFVLLFDPKIFNYQDELYSSLAVVPKPRN